MDNVIVSLFFFSAGAASVAVLSATSFVIFTSVVSAAYLIYVLSTAIGGASVLLPVFDAFVSIQVGYVAGISLRAFWVRQSSKVHFPFLEVIKKENTKIK